jgi:hypothetical protein
MKFNDEQNDTWELRPSEAVTSGSALAKDATDARMYLERVVAEHEGTPWALDAANELRQPLGWQWRETFTDVAGRIARAQAGNNDNRPRPEPPVPPRRPRRDPPAL